MEGTLARNWGWIAVRGVLALLFGLLTLFNPAITIVTLVLLYGAFAFANGIFSVVSVIANRRGEPHWVGMLLAGLAGIAAGVVTFFLPALTATVLLIVIGVWAIITGVAEVVAAVRLRKVITGEWMLGLAGVLSALFGFFVLSHPAAGALAIAVWIGAYAIIYGVVLLALAFRLRSWAHRHHTGGTLHPA